MSETQRLWKPDNKRIASSELTRFANWLAERGFGSFHTYDALHKFSVTEPALFWNAAWDYCGIIGVKGERVLENAKAMPGAQFFPDARLNFAQNLLRKSGSQPALIFQAEDKMRSSMNWDELRALVSQLQQAFVSLGLGKGDRVAAMMPNMPQTIACMLAAASIGAIWSSCSPDFGERGVIDRFGQIEPRLFIACESYWYAGKVQDVTAKLASIIPQLNPEKTIIVGLAGNAKEAAASLPDCVDIDSLITGFVPRELEFAELPFDHPLYILFSSGTTGVPKCIVHCHGGVLLKHLVEQRLQSDIGDGDRFFYFTTCGWMMWNWLASGLACGATLMLYDGSPFHPGPEVLFDYAAREKCTFFGTSAKFIDSVRKSGLEPVRQFDLSSIKTIASTGSPLAPENFDFCYRAIAPDAHLASISGGTDICGCFVGGNPWSPVYKGEIQGPALGMAVEVWDEDGYPAGSEKGELVCTTPFPSMPTGFWADPDGAKYHDAYFSRFPGVWRHGDFAQWTEHGGMIIHGRSDATLNPGGVRIGTAEIYNVVEQMPQIAEAICIGHDWQDDTRVVMFVRLAPGVELNEGLEREIRTRVRAGASPRHVPARILAVADIPRTKSGKITELAVRDIVHGRKINNVEALANPEALDIFRQLIPELNAR